MKITHISTYDVGGGAARAAYRLHRGLLQIGVDSKMLVRYKDSQDESVILLGIQDGNKGLEPTGSMGEVSDEAFFLTEVIQKHYIDSNRTDISNTIFSFPYPGFDLSNHSEVRDADVIILHWVAYDQSPITLQKLFCLGKPVIWTLHDQWAFTGGCHYSAGCEKYRDDCFPCHQLVEDPYGLPKAVLQDKRELYHGADLTIVSPSRWLAACAGKSVLFQDRKVEVVPYSLETEVFKPVTKTKARNALNIPQGRLTLLFGAENGAEKRKGFHHMISALRCCRENRRFNDLLKMDRIQILCFGAPSPEMGAMDVPVISLGRLGSDEKIRDAYNAADLFILPSLEDNLPNTILESMSCGTPVVAFDIGGVPDLVKDGHTGRVVPSFDTRQMAEAIVEAVLDPGFLERAGESCRKHMEHGYHLARQAERYLELIQPLLEDKEPKKRKYNENIQYQKRLGTELDTTLGPHSQPIYEKVLFKALKKFAPVVQKKLEFSERDREARLVVIHEIGEKLRVSERDRDARLSVIHELAEKLRNSEEDREARLKVMHELEERLRQSELDRQARLSLIDELGERLRVSEEDRAARLSVIEKQDAEILRLHHELDHLQGEYRQLSEQHRQLSEQYRQLNDRYRQLNDQYHELRKQLPVRVLHKLRLIKAGSPD